MDIEDIYEDLKKKGFIDYGKVIPKEVLEKYIDEKFQHGNWGFIGRFLQLKEYIEDQGYFCTSRKCGPGSLRVLYPNEWAHKLSNVHKTVMRRQKRATETMRQADMDVLGNRDKAILRHELNKLNMGLHAMSSILHDL